MVASSLLSLLIPVCSGDLVISITSPRPNSTLVPLSTSFGSCPQSSSTPPRPQNQYQRPIFTTLETIHQYRAAFYDQLQPPQPDAAGDRQKQEATHHDLRTTRYPRRPVHRQATLRQLHWRPVCPAGQWPALPEHYAGHRRSLRRVPAL